MPGQCVRPPMPPMAAFEGNIVILDRHPLFLPKGGGDVPPPPPVKRGGYITCLMSAEDQVPGCLLWVAQRHRIRHVIQATKLGYHPSNPTPGRPSPTHATDSSLTFAVPFSGPFPLCRNSGPRLHSFPTGMRFLSRDLPAPGAHPRSLPLPPPPCCHCHSAATATPLPGPPPLPLVATPHPPRASPIAVAPLPCRPASQLPSSTCFRRRQKDTLLARHTRTELPPLNLLFCFNLTLDNLSHQDGECPRRPLLALLAYRREGVGRSLVVLSCRSQPQGASFPRRLRLRHEYDEKQRRGEPGCAWGVSAGIR